MPALANPRHERFAQAIFTAMAKAEADQRPWSQGAAYKAAGFDVTNAASARACASRLLSFANGVGARVRELQANAARRKEVTVASIVDELEEAREVAARNDQASAMVAATSTKAKVLGLSVERHEHGTPGSFEQAQSTTELAEAMLRQANPGIGAISEDMRAMALEELARHAEAMAAIAQGMIEA